MNRVFGALFHTHSLHPSFPLFASILLCAHVSLLLFFSLRYFHFSAHSRCERTCVSGLLGIFSCVEYRKFSYFLLLFHFLHRFVAPPTFMCYSHDDFSLDYFLFHFLFQYIIIRNNIFFCSFALLACFLAFILRFIDSFAIFSLRIYLKEWNGVFFFLHFTIAAEMMRA